MSDWCTFYVVKNGRAKSYSVELVPGVDPRDSMLLELLAAWMVEKYHETHNGYEIDTWGQNLGVPNLMDVVEDNWGLCVCVCGFATYDPSCPACGASFFA